MRCGSCAWDNQAGVAFCTNCGLRLGGDDPPRAAAVPSMPAGEVRKAEDLGLSATVIQPCLGDSEPAGPMPDETPPAGRVCGACGTPNASTMNFCCQCGGPLGAAATARPEPHTPSGAAPAHPTALSEQARPASPRLVTLLKDGSEGRSIPLNGDRIDLGRTEGDVILEDDVYLSARHARIEASAGGFRLVDMDSVNGIYVRTRGTVELRDGDMVLLGQQVLRFERLAEAERSLHPARQRGVLVFGTPEMERHARLVRYTTEGVGRDVYYLFRDETILGRENGDIVFTDDPFLSRKHAAVRVDASADRYTLHDLGSSNGTAVRMRGAHILRAGDEFRMGRHLFRYEAPPGEASR